jgi:hypothetical protein
VHCLPAIKIPRGIDRGNFWEAAHTQDQRQYAAGKRPEIIAAIRGLMTRDDAAPSFPPLLRRPLFHDAEVLAIVLHAWPRLTPPERLQAIKALLDRTALVDVAELASR